MITRPVVRFERTGLFLCVAVKEAVDDGLGNCETVLAGMCYLNRAGRGLSIQSRLELAEAVIDQVNALLH